MNSLKPLTMTFHPAVQRWFGRVLGKPTPPQLEAWPAIMSGKHTLIAAPTGSGKTLAAFLVAINQLVEEGLSQGNLQDNTLVLYVSPLKALGNDILRNLELPLQGIGDELLNEGKQPVEIRTAVRTGDTPQAERQRMLRTPPHILVTTPESLYLLLTAKGGRKLLRHVRTVIIDEIHAMLGDKRGAHLSLSLERLQALVSHPIQRIGLSATQKPINTVAEFLTGQRSDEPLKIVDTGHQRQWLLSVEVPRSPLTSVMANEVWEEIYQRLVELVEQHSSTLIFVNTRRLAERLALALANKLGEEVVSSHHGSMSKEQRINAEQSLKHGQLKVLVATASMELGIDVGAVDLVVQVSSPKRISAMLQRVGRSGHYVGGVPKGILFPLTRDDLVESVALLDAINRGELDQLIIPSSPLDILAQQLVAEIASTEAEEAPQSIDYLWDWVSRSWSYRDLKKEDLRAVLVMLAEGYSTRRGRSGILLHYDAINDTVRPRRGARLMALTNGGAIPDMFDYQVVLDPEDIVVGTLNEEFALESLPGDIFSLGNHSWRLLKIDGLKVRVADAHGESPTVPFWIGEGPGRSRELSVSVARLKTKLNELFNESLVAGQEWLSEQVNVSTGVAEQLCLYLYTGSRHLNAMPTQDNLVLERFFDEVGDMHVVVHSPFGMRVNKAWGLALRKRFCRSFNFELQAAANEDAIIISLGSVHSFELGEVYSFLQSATVRDVLIQALLDAPMFELRWRWNASRALAVQRNRGGHRVPPQFQRMAAEDFVAQVFPDQLACLENITGARSIPDHPLVQQTITDCLTEAMDIEALEMLLKQMESGEVMMTARDLREPSPFAQEIINARPYAFLDDTPFEERRTLAIRHRSWMDPREANDASVLERSAIDKVREEAWPFIRSPDELHDALIQLGYLTELEMHGSKEYEDSSIFLETLLKQGRVTQARHSGVRIWIAAESQPQFAALSSSHGVWTFHPVQTLPLELQQRTWEPEAALRELLRGRLEGLGPVYATRFTQELGIAPKKIQLALLALETEGFAFQGHYTPLDGNSARPAGLSINNESLDYSFNRENRNANLKTHKNNNQKASFNKAGSILPGHAPKEWCERRLLQRIHRYSLEQHREQIKPISLQVYMLYLFDLHGVTSQSQQTTIPGSAEQLRAVLNRLDGYTAPATAWEAEILPSRINSYDSRWLDQLCSSGFCVWGRLLQPKDIIAGVGIKSGPLKSSPINLLTRGQLSLWHKLANIDRQAHSGDENKQDVIKAELSASAQQVLQFLYKQGASFFDELRDQCRLLNTQLEEILAELVSVGLVTSDNFIGLRALLTPQAHKSRTNRKGQRQSRRSLFKISDAGRWSLLSPSKISPTDSSEGTVYLSEEELERLINIYLGRWGVLHRRIMERESAAPPWRDMLRHLRRLELRGEIRGGRFIAGIGGEQFARAETVDSLRRHQRLWQEEEQRNITKREPVRMIINATDPLNLLGCILPQKRVAHLVNNRILFEDGIPVAVWEKDEMKPLNAKAEKQAYLLEQFFLQRHYSVSLKSNLRNQ